MANVSPTDRKADVQLLGLKAMLLEGTSDVSPFVAALSARPTDQAAGGWAALIRATDPARPVDLRQAVGLCVTAARDDPDNVAARYELGRAYVRMGEPGLALECLEQASQLAPAWAAPRLATAEVLLDRNQPSAAAGPARSASARDPSSPAVRAVLAVIDYRTLSPQAAPADVAAALAAVRSAAAADPSDARLPAAAVDLLVRSNRRADAAASGVAAVNAPAATPAAVYRLATVAAVDHLPEVLTAVAARADALPAGTPSQAYDVAMAWAATGQPDRGRQLLAGHATADWELAALRFREATAPPSAQPPTDAWAALADANPSDLSVQRAALKSPAATRSRPLVDRTIDRLHALTGDDGVEWRLARARFLLDLPETGPADGMAGGMAGGGANGQPTAKDAAAAVVSSMAEVARLTKWTPEPHELWATALERQGNLLAAADRLADAARLAPDDPAVSVRLARLLVRLGRFADAAEAVDPLARSADRLPPALAADVADVFRRSGQPPRAVAVLRAADPNPTDPARAVALATALAAAGDAAGARATFDRVNGSPAATVDTVRAAAWFKAGAGDVAGGRGELARLDRLPAVSAVERGIARGQFDAAFGDPDAARSALEGAAAAAPDDPRPWAALAGFDLRVGASAPAVLAAERGLTLAPSDAALSALRQRAQTLSKLHLGPAAKPLIDALAADPSNPAAVAALDALASPPDADAVNAVAAQFPTFIPAQALVVDALVRSGRYDDAAAVAQRAMDAAPADPSPAQLLASVWTAAGRPDAALNAAGQWRARSLAAPQSADAAAAEADLQLGRPADAVHALQPYLANRTADDRTVATYAPRPVRRRPRGRRRPVARPAGRDVGRVAGDVARHHRRRRPHGRRRGPADRARRGGACPDGRRPGRRGQCVVHRGDAIRRCRRPASWAGRPRPVDGRNGRVGRRPGDPRRPPPTAERVAGRRGGVPPRARRQPRPAAGHEQPRVDDRAAGRRLGRRPPAGRPGRRAATRRRRRVGDARRSGPEAERRGGCHRRVQEGRPIVPPVGVGMGRAGRRPGPRRPRRRRRGGAGPGRATAGRPRPAAVAHDGDGAGPRPRRPRPGRRRRRPLGPGRLGCPTTRAIRESPPYTPASVADLVDGRSSSGGLKSRAVSARIGATRPGSGRHAPALFGESSIQVRSPTSSHLATAGRRGQPTAAAERRVQRGRLPVVRRQLRRRVHRRLHSSPPHALPMPSGPAPSGFGVRAGRPPRCVGRQSRPGHRGHQREQSRSRPDDQARGLRCGRHPRVLDRRCPATDRPSVC